MKPIEDYTDSKQLENLMGNAKRLGNNEIYWKAFSRFCELQGISAADPLEREFLSTLAAHERLLTEKNGRTTLASRTRQKLRNKGVIQCLEDWSLEDKPTDGFQLLTANGLKTLTGEFLVVKYPEKFSSKAVEAAKKRLANLT